MKPEPVTIRKIQETSLRLNGKELTAKQAIATKVYIETGNKSEAGRQAYPNQKPTSAKSQGTETLSLPTTKNVLNELMDTIGLTDGYLLEKLTNGIENGDNEGFQHLKLAFELKGKLQKVNVNLSHTIKETRKGYDL